MVTLADYSIPGQKLNKGMMKKGIKTSPLASLCFIVTWWVGWSAHGVPLYILQMMGVPIWPSTPSCTEFYPYGPVLLPARNFFHAPQNSECILEAVEPVFLAHI
jgi:hypothetical protein